MLFLRPINNQQMSMAMDMFIVDSLNCRRLCPALSWQILDAVSLAGPWHFQPGSFFTLREWASRYSGWSGREQGSPSPKREQGSPFSKKGAGESLLQASAFLRNASNSLLIAAIVPAALTSRSRCADSFYFLFFHQFSLFDNISE
jgi:hypothetical protein